MASKRTALGGQCSLKGRLCTCLRTKLHASRPDLDHSFNINTEIELHSAAQGNRRHPSAARLVKRGEVSVSGVALRRFYCAGP